MSNLETTTLGIALVGALLGILNTWRAFDRDRVRLKVIPQSGVLSEADRSKRFLAIQIVNLSAFPITVSDAGFQLCGAKVQEYRVLPHLDDGGSLPHRLDARADVTLQFPTDSYDDRYMSRALRAYATTACGRRFTGTSPSLKQYLREITNAGDA